MSVFEDPQVTQVDGGYRVVRHDGTTLLVLPRETGGGDWAAYFGTASVKRRVPYCGIPGSESQGPEKAIEWALR